MSEFLYVYRGGDDRWARSPEEAQQVMQKWITWMQGLAERGHLKDRGHPLEPQGKLVSGSSKTVTDGPYAEKDVVGGFRRSSAFLASAAKGPLGRIFR